MYSQKWKNINFESEALPVESNYLMKELKLFYFQHRIMNGTAIVLFSKTLKRNYFHIAVFLNILL